MNILDSLLNLIFFQSRGGRGLFYWYNISFIYVLYGGLSKEINCNYIHIECFVVRAIVHWSLRYICDETRGDKRNWKDGEKEECLHIFLRGTFSFAFMATGFFAIERFHATLFVVRKWPHRKLEKTEKKNARQKSSSFSSV